MKIIGITGKSGCGKSTFASLLSQKLNCQHIDIDKIGHQAILQPEIITALCDEFGNQILNDDGSINRKKLGAIVFVNKDKMKILEDLTYGYMQKCLDNILSQNNECIVLEYILLPRTKYWNMCDSKVLVKSDDVQRKNKVIERDHISPEYFDKRDSASIDYSPFNFDYIYENDYQQESMNKMFDKISEQYIGDDER